MSNKVSCSNVRALVLEEENPTNDVDAAEKRQDETDLSKLDMPPPLLALCQFVQTQLKPINETMRVHIPKEVFGTNHDTYLLCEDILQFASMIEIGSIVIAVYMRYLFDYLKMANMVNLVGLIDPRKHLKNANGDLFYLVPYNLGSHWVLIIDIRNIVNISIKIYNSHIGKQSSLKSAIWKNLHGTPRQPINVECGYYVMRFMRDIIHDPGLAFEKKFDKKMEPVQYVQEHIDEVRLEWAEFINKQLHNNK
ncbi:hypothetical protein L3X38_037140 [Prunus dulcis]|uniref:Ubiquitin-like protease family profile domain-containing protein n=1 Tax=Prunus dulcis TaxID=3755 RepID=A0AAD4V346_PRUDU|nr:hypothetical protein L3X38_037140 [Prunus dulcis]